MKTIDERIKDLENTFVTRNGLPGTQLVRTLFDDGIGWSLGVGHLGEEKLCYVGKTIEEVLSLAEKHHH